MQKPDPEHAVAAATFLSRCNEDVITTGMLALRLFSMRVEHNDDARREALNIRIKPQVRQLIDEGARLAGKNRTDFILDAARGAAQNALLDRTLLAVSPAAWRQFLSRLDAPPRPNKRLLKSMRTPAPWK
jgi:uncharacterized protein (DUF1778 family)